MKNNVVDIGARVRCRNRLGAIIQFFKVPPPTDGLVVSMSTGWGKRRKSRANWKRV